MKEVYRLNWRVVDWDFIKNLRDNFDVQFDYHCVEVDGVKYHNYCTYKVGE